MASSLLVKRSALHHWHLACGATMVADGGWQRPEQYGSTDEEIGTVHTSVGMCDISPVGKLDLKGTDLSAVLEQRLSFDAAPQIGHVERIRLTGVVGVGGISRPNGLDGLCCRLTHDNVLLTTPAGTRSALEQLCLEKRQESSTPDTCAHLTDLTSALTAIQLVGPASPELLSKLISLDLSPSQFPDLRCAQASIATVHAMLIRADIGSHLTYEIYCRRECGEYMWETLYDAGQEFGVIPFGLATQRLLLTQD